jgi:hypothetical protein
MFIPTLAILLAFMHPSSPTMTAQDTGRVSSTSSSLHEPTRIPDQGQLPYMCDPAVCDGILAGERASRLGPYRGILQGIARTHFGRQRNDTVRLEGIRRLSTLTDTGYLFAMPDVYRAERNDVRRAVIDHLAESGEVGQAALAWTAVFGKNADMRLEASAAIRTPASPAVLGVIQIGLRGTEHATIDQAGRLAGVIDAWAAIPHLIATQYAADPVREKRDLAWIAIGTQRSYVQNLIPVTGDGAGAFQPVIGQVTEGFVMRVTDAIAIIYRTEVHHALVGITSRATGTDTSRNGWSFTAWRDWYNDEFLAIARARANAATDAEAAAGFAEAERRRHERDERDDSME